MKRPNRAVVMLAACAFTALPLHPALAAVNVEREGSENPVMEIAKSTMYGALAGSVIGLALEAANQGTDNGETFRWSFVAGTFIGLGAGIYFTATRPKASALLEFQGGEIHLGALEPEFSKRGVRVRLVGTSF